ncbi:MAG TPA: hypothetical protein DDX85_13930 [Nitrospiraceae bacterium]|nr:hypothetical protein [Nitrospiraceae bacterium]
MAHEKSGIKKIYIFCILFLISCSLFVSCGYRFIGSRSLPFDSITIKPVKNNTYEPKLEEKMHLALSQEFINMGMEVKAAGSEAVLETTIKTFALGAIAAVDELVKEQEIIMEVDLRLTSKGKITEFNSMVSPIKITYESTGTVRESVSRKEAAADKACREIAKEIVSKLIIEYAK